MIITKESMHDCALRLGQFDSTRVNSLVLLYRHQSSGSQLNVLSNNLKEKFENLLSIKNDNEKTNDTPLTRIELSMMIHFRETYLSEPIIEPDRTQIKSNKNFSINDELNLAYCYLLAQIDDRIWRNELQSLKFLLKISPVVIENLFDIYQATGEEISKFFTKLIVCEYFKTRIVIIHETIQAFQLFIKRYEDFLITFKKYYQLSSDNGYSYVQTDAIINQENNQHSTTTIVRKKDVAVPTPNIQSQKKTISPPINRSMISSSSNIPRKGLCVIINITKIVPNPSVKMEERPGSEKDVNLIKSVFQKLNFTVLECGFDFHKMHLNQALDQIDDKQEFGNFDCLAIFIMSHGLLHSVFTADGKETIIRDIVKRYSDTSPTTIWRGKPRMFFIQACRSPWPEHLQSDKREAIKPNDLSPQMLVAYSCSATEVSKRYKDAGSIFIQMLCINILRYSRFYGIQYILNLTADFVIKYDEHASHYKPEVNIQRPEYIEKDFNINFRFSNDCLYNQLSSWNNEIRSSIYISISIWDEVYRRIYKNSVST